MNRSEHIERMARRRVECYERDELLDIAGLVLVEAWMDEEGSERTIAECELGECPTGQALASLPLRGRMVAFTREVADE